MADRPGRELPGKKAAFMDDGDLGMLPLTEK
jgi:hypothetical protein